MLAIAWPSLTLALAPIVAVEAWVLSRRLGIAAWEAAKLSGIANAVSTLLGVPLTWGGLVAFQLLTGGGRSHGLGTPVQKVLAVTWQAPWLIPYEKDLYWMVPAASLVLLLPFFLASCWLEQLVVGRLAPECGRGAIRRAVLGANVTSYGGLVVLTLVWLGWSIASRDAV